MNPIEALRGAGRTAGDRASFARKALLVVQATLSVVLVAGSTMLGRSLGNLQGQDFGFNRDGRVIVSVGRPAASFTGERLTALYRDVEARLARIPGVQGAGLALYNPLTNNWGEGVLVAGKPLPAPGEQTGASWDRVSTNYLQHLGVKLVRGRHFTEADNETSQNVAVVNEAFVKRFFKPEEDPLDQHFGLNLPENVNSFRIVGVVGDARFAGFQLERPMRPMFFVPLAQTVNYANEMMRRVETSSHYVGGLLLVTSTPPGALEPQVARALAEADPNLAVINIRTLAEQVERTFDRQRAVASLAGHVRRDRAHPGRDRALRRDGLLGGAPHQRDRRAHGARRRSWTGDGPRARRRVQARGGGLGARRAVGDWRRVSAVRAALRRRVLGSGGADRGRRRAGVRLVRRGRRARGAGHRVVADEGAPHRVSVTPVTCAKRVVVR